MKQENKFLLHSGTYSVSSFAVINLYHAHKELFFLKEIGFIADGWLQRVHNLSSVTTVPVTSYIEVLQNVVLYLFNGGRSEV